MTDYPLRHISIRVPWHDAGWAGVVCTHPQLNGACTKLKGIAGAKRDDLEAAVAGKRLSDLPREQWPCCIGERATFMAPFEMEQLRRHALAERNKKTYGHFLPTPQRYPAYSAGIVPFRWMMRGEAEAIGSQFELDVDLNREPELGYETNWIHEAKNQAALLNGFSSHLRAEDSLCLFYAKHVPFVEGTGRILIGAGRVKQIGPLIEYGRQGEGMAGMVWERPIQHSIRAGGQDGFLLPYAEVLSRSAGEPSLDLERYTAHAPADHWDEFSYGSELVTHDGGIAALLSIDATLDRIERELGIATKWQRQWVHDELVRLWKVRGPFPGLGAVLTAFGVSRGIFLAHALQHRAGENADPWPEVAAVFADQTLLPVGLRRDLKELARTWNGLADSRRSFLRLLSRFELSLDQAKQLYESGARDKAGWTARDEEILRNPYRLYEITRHDPDGVKLHTIDRGVFPEDVVRLLHPLEEPSRLESAVDVRRVKAFSLAALERAAGAGHTLIFASDLAQEIQADDVKPACPVTTDTIQASAAAMAPEIVSSESAGQPVLQLDRYLAIRNLVRKNVEGRIGGQRHKAAADWAALLRDAFRNAGTDSDEIRAQQEKAAALAELAESRFSVLAGPAGAGKTSVLGILCTRPEIQNDGLLLLAPTGKARVRMQQLAGSAGANAQTIAQFLNKNGRYDGHAGRYHLSDAPKVTGFGTVIIDEASMLAEDMLGAVFDALQQVKRFILVGDPAQLPPIGAGRPFVDIIARLRPDDCEARFPRVAPGYAELTIERRQVGADCPDLRLARWFSSSAPAAGADDVFDAPDDAHSRLRFVSWDKPEDFQRKLVEVLATELRLANDADQRGFNRELGATVSGEYDYFNPTRNGKPGAVERVESWQILSPLRGMPFGVGDINRQVQQRYRASLIEFASRQWGRAIPQPMGPERIVYGSKVINLSNHRRDGRRVYPQDGAIGYLANGEIGVVVGQWKSNGNPKILKVEFSSQSGYTYDFYKGDFREEGDPSLELAYALTIHKAQGSQFGLVILVLPEAHPILSRELIYTALTRHQQRVVVMHQGQRSLLRDFSAPHRSETARRRTNLLAECRLVAFPQPKGNLFLQEGLIHRTSQGLAVRSKSELLIAEALISSNVTFEYEKPLSLGGQRRYPDFTIEDEISGRTIYWEHLGMLDREDYKAAWNAKLSWYRANGVEPLAEAKSGAPILITTEDSGSKGLDMTRVKNLIAEVCGA